MTRKTLILLAVAMTTSACTKSVPDDAGAEVRRISDEFVAAYYAQFPEEVYEVGYPDAPTDRFGDRSEESYARWNSRVDGWLAELDAIDAEQLAGTPHAVTYAFTHERLQAIADRRVCRMSLWNVSPTWTGWQFAVIATLAVQPVSSATERDHALDRAADIERLVGVEIDNLRRGEELGYRAPQSNVIAVVDQFASLIVTPTEESPFFDPATRSDDSEFVEAYREVFDNRIRPSLVAYRDFLANEYEGREEIGVAANPDGEACYEASTRYWSSLEMSAADIHRAGLSEMSRLRAEMLEIAKESFDTDDLPALFNELRSNPEYTFSSEEAMLDYVKAAVARGEQAAPAWFGYVPDVGLEVIATPAYEKDSGGGFYAAGSTDGSRPGTYQVGTYNPTGISRAGTESTAFHESYPGHHLQVSIALLNESLPPILRYMYVSGSAEGWALYCERLADEMGLYSSELSRLGMLSNEAYRAARLVVDPGIHVFGWSREEAIQYMMENTAEGYDAVSGEIDRYAAVPGQATSYLLGSLEIQRLRSNAESLLNERFDIREFHDRILADGSVTLPMLKTSIDAWIEEVLARD